MLSRAKSSVSATPSVAFSFARVLGVVLLLLVAFSAAEGTHLRGLCYGGCYGGGGGGGGGYYGNSFYDYGNSLYNYGYSMYSNCCSGFYDSCCSGYGFY